MKRTRFLMMLMVLVMSVSVIAFNNHLTGARGTIYIRPDGSVEPVTAPISKVDNVTYILTDNIYEPIVVQKDNITIMGNGYSLQGSGGGTAIALPQRTNVTVVNIKIISFEYGISLSGYNNKVFNNEITNCKIGISLSGGSFNKIFRNNISGRGSYDSIGINLEGAYERTVNCSLFENYVKNCGYGLRLGCADYNYIWSNIIVENDYGVYLHASSSNNITANYVENNENGIYIWDNSKRNIVKDNRVSQNTVVGIWIAGKSDENILFRNLVTSNYDGISVSACSSNVTGNEVVQNKGIGVFLWGANNTFRNNSMVNNKYNFKFRGWKEKDISDFINDIDASNKINHKPIYYLINQQDLVIPADASYIVLVSYRNITVQNLKLVSNGQGLLLAFTTNSVITQNVIAANEQGGITVYNSSNIFIIRNIIAENGRDTRELFGHGLRLSSSSNINIIRNNITSNYDGIILDQSSDINIIGNNIRGNRRSGILLSGSLNYSIYHNNFVANNPHIYVPTYVIGAYNRWDNGYPSGGNYWDDYSGSNKKGIGYPPRGVTFGEQDNYPLMGPINIYDVENWDAETFEVHIISNFTVSDFSISREQKMVRFIVTGHEHATGFCRLTIPNLVIDEMWQGNYTVLLNGLPIEFENWTIAEYTYIYFEYNHSSQEVMIAPESPVAVLLLTIVLSLFTVAFSKRSMKKPVTPVNTFLNFILFPEKGSNPRIFKMSGKLVSMLHNLPRKDLRVFTYKNSFYLRKTFTTQRKK